MRSVTALLVVGLLVGSVGYVSEAHAQQPTPPVTRPVRKGTKYTVKIDSSPQQAAIYLDDKQYGIVAYTPYTGKLTKGDYKLILVRPGFKTLERQIHVDASSREFFLPLEKEILPGTIDVQVAADPNVAGAQVFIDGQLQGTAPNAVDVPEGRHLLEIKKQTFADYGQWVNVKQGERVTVTPVLKSAITKGSLLIDADVPGASVSVDGQAQSDTAPVMVDNLDEGPHIVEVKKDPAPPWKQTVYVKPGVRTKVNAELGASVAAASGGSIRVISNNDGAEVWVDGTDKGKPPQDVTGLSPGVHLVEVKADGFDTSNANVTVTAGQSTVVKLDLNKTSGARIHVVSPVPEAKVFIDGALAGSVPIDTTVTPGEHFVVVQHDGYTKYEAKLTVEAGKNVDVSAELRAAGGVRLLANVDGADVFIDQQPVGKAPFVKEDVDVGDHMITVRHDGYIDFQAPVHVEGGKMQVVEATLTKIDTESRQRTALSSWGARTMPNGRFSVDAAAGYPYWLQLRATVGVQDEKLYGIDVSVGFRSLLTTWEFLGTGRFRFIDQNPFALAAFGTVGGGGGLSGRNEFTLQGGILGSISFNQLITVTGRAYLDIWSDRLCAAPASGMVVSDEGPDVCQGKADSADAAKAVSLAGTDIYARNNGARVMISLIVEASIQKYVGIFFIFEGRRCRTSAPHSRACSTARCSARMTRVTARPPA